MEAQYQLLAKLIKWQIAEPARALVNPEAAFVRTKLEVLGEVALAKQYWSWHCSGSPAGVFPNEIEQLQTQLRAIDRGQTMPQWGTSGT